MSQTITELKQLRAKLIKEMREILDVASAEGRNLSAEETEKYDRIEADVDGFTATVDRQEKQARAETSITSAVAEARVSTKAMTKQERAGSEENRNAYNKYLR